jgi:hypothetical protein
VGGVWVRMNEQTVCGKEDVLIYSPMERVVTGVRHIIWTIATGNHSSNGHITSSSHC